jgi:hypothetical protein
MMHEETRRHHHMLEHIRRRAGGRAAALLDDDAAQPDACAAAQQWAAQELYEYIEVDTADAAADAALELDGGERQRDAPVLPSYMSIQATLVVQAVHAAGLHLASPCTHPSMSHSPSPIPCRATGHAAGAGSDRGAHVVRPAPETSAK